jgi:hypothetical protein
MSTQLPLTPVASDCAALVRTAIQHVTTLAVQWPVSVTLALACTPTITAAQRRMDQAALTGDRETTQELARTYYRVWARELAKHPKTANERRQA